ncbi:hypothetical protein C2S52_020133 [Perilla frutescens var. hirtella]|uniref:Uncharacterized protein n=1 Tax=Perilla frutescens var. hirtella TaxID=608512 RepID=A0AAD4J5G6_PERFH|nr:hypothetical protein C2S52_020133 [Perilla frutescens var. hirtella]KAH6805665.1 hypothetical protein C2S51_030496 [Perilla frutescens var. frutescens]KAH6827226.1 hypothetical protein C2S53_000746 [Perilla frutescens var. hirtella]
MKPRANSSHLDTQHNMKFAISSKGIGFHIWLPLTKSALEAEEATIFTVTVYHAATAAVYDEVTPAALTGKWRLYRGDSLAVKFMSVKSIGLGRYLSN